LRAFPIGRKLPPTKEAEMKLALALGLVLLLTACGKGIPLIPFI
jgi:hypothetical protein